MPMLVPNTSEIIPSMIVATITKYRVVWNIHEISTRHASALGVKIDKPFVAVASDSVGIRHPFPSLYEAIDFVLGDHKRPLPTWEDWNLVELIDDETNERGVMNDSAIVVRLVRSLIGAGQLHVCEFDHVLLGELDTENQEPPCPYCQFEDIEQADAMHNARTEVHDDFEWDPGWPPQ